MNHPSISKLVLLTASKCLTFIHKALTPIEVSTNLTYISELSDVIDTYFIALISSQLALFSCLYRSVLICEFSKQQSPGVNPFPILEAAT
jgi:hypothetical protein